MSFFDPSISPVITPDHEDIKIYDERWEVDIQATLDNYHSLLMFWFLDTRSGFEVYDEALESIDIEKTLEFTKRAFDLVMWSRINIKKGLDSSTILFPNTTVDKKATQRYSFLLRSTVLWDNYMNLDTSQMQTWYEVYNKHWDIDINASMEFINLSMRKRSPQKYGDFLSTVLSGIGKALEVMQVPNKTQRKRLFQLVYFSMRMLDDIYDNDTNIELAYDLKNTLYTSLVDFPKNIENIPNALLQSMFLEISKVSESLWVDREMLQSMREIIKSMWFDHERIYGNDKKRRRWQLENNFHLMDIVWTISGTAIIFGIEPEQAKQLLTPLWKACRLIYNLQDFYEDISVWLINIPLEDLKKFSITESDLQQVRDFDHTSGELKYITLPASMKKWFQQEIWKIYDLLDEHNENMKEDFFYKVQNKWVWNYGFNFTQRLREWVMKDNVIPQTYTNEIERDAFVIARLVA